MNQPHPTAMARITQECVARIKDSADIVELLGKYLQLRRAGNSWKACCPFHRIPPVPNLITSN